MSKYLIMIFQDEVVSIEDAGESVSADYVAFMQRRGAHLLNGAALEPPETATTVRRDGSGGFSVTDGPFAESKETLGGYYLIEAADLDEALEIAKEIPAGIGVEVRPVRVAS
ncbi:YciI family protein [Arthrobacter sp. GMC3]|uniref:YciI family protein n=1 Tax=Arthrobacter sp. GMC3 TaxID=2058894 RepID=UPI000CE3CD7D|nr:YciI family protein [Arthrobacter sp. GMC3]